MIEGLSCNANILLTESAKIMRLRAYEPYPSLIYALRADTFTLINKRLTRLCLVLCCVATIEG